MTFDEAYEKYKTARAALRQTQGDLSKAFQSREMLNLGIEQLEKKYKRLHRNLEAAQLALIPELDKEVASAPKPNSFKIGELAPPATPDPGDGEPVTEHPKSEPSDNPAEPAE